MNEPIWIDKADALTYHDLQISTHGGSHGLRDEGLLESALGRPLNLFHYSAAPSSIFELASAYAYGIAKNHPFIDGNKRTALVVAFTFLALNGIEVVAAAESRYSVFYGLAAGEVTEAELAAWLKANSRSSM